MLDSVKLKRPLKDEAEAALIEAQLQTMTKTDNASDTELFRFVGGCLEGSFSNNIAVNVKREVYARVQSKATGKYESVTRACGWGFYPNGQPEPRPYLTIEGSVHKAMIGHNCFGGPLDPVAGCFWYITHVCGLLGINVGNLAEWLVLRVDWAECFNFGSYQAVDEFIHSMKLASYPRRKTKIDDGCILWPSTNVTPKLYHKGKEFQNNGYKTVEKFFGCDQAVNLLGVSNGILRSEITVKSKRLKLEATTPGHGEMPVVQLKREWLEALHDTEVCRVFHEGKADMQSVRTHEAVNARLREIYDMRLAELLFGVWMQMAALGEKEYRKKVPRTTFYRQRQQLADVGITWIGSDIGVVKSNCIPLDFSFRRDSPYRMTQELPQVSEMLAPFQMVA